MATQITKYEISPWGNIKTGERWFGVRAFVVGHGWMNVTEGTRAAIFPARRMAKEFIDGMKKDRDKRGFKKKLKVSETSGQRS